MDAPTRQGISALGLRYSVKPPVSRQYVCTFVDISSLFLFKMAHQTPRNWPPWMTVSFLWSLFLPSCLKNGNNVKKNWGLPRRHSFTQSMVNFFLCTLVLYFCMMYSCNGSDRSWRYFFESQIFVQWEPSYCGRALVLEIYWLHRALEY